MPIEKPSNFNHVTEERILIVEGIIDERLNRYIGKPIRIDVDFLTRYIPFGEQELNRICQDYKETGWTITIKRRWWNCYWEFS